MSSKGICVVNLIVSISVDLRACITRNGQKRCLLTRRIDSSDHERIAAPNIVFSLIDT